MPKYLAAEVAVMVGTPYRTLMGWVAHGLLNPINARQGQRIQTYWQAKDVREASVLAGLRQAGLSLQNIKRACAYLRSLGHNPMSTGQFLVVRSGRGEPKDLVKFCDEGEAVELLRHPGQLIMRLWSEEEN